MRFINRRRGSGKTTMLINSAYTTGYPIIVPTLAHKNFIIEKSFLQEIMKYTIALLFSLNNPENL